MQPSRPETPPFIRIGIDIGGTFTDFVVFDPASGNLQTFKVPSTPRNPAEAVFTGLARVRTQAPNSSARIVHGSTVATNALLERKGAPTALITTKGFRDVLQIGRQNRPELYDLAPSLPPPLIPAARRFEVDERIDSAGCVLAPLDETQIPALIAKLQSAATPVHPHPIESVAVSLLFSFLHPAHEAALARSLREAGFFVSVSHEIIPEYREYERTATTVVNAYVSPVMDKYLREIEEALTLNAENGKHNTLQIMQSNGGIISPAQARAQAVRCILSGPAGGVVAAEHVATEGEGRPCRALTFDMGGTSTDVALIEGEPHTTTEAVIGGMPIRVPVLDIHTIGAGGGSIAHIDAGGALRVGPQSAGAAPGPACYGRTVDSDTRLTPDTLFPTVTDANLLLGRLHPEHFLGGEMPLYPARARAAITPLAKQLGLTLTKTALGIVEIANAHMERALRVISVARGHDPRGFTLVSFGGAGGLHAAALARRLGIPQVLISPHASTLSALGMLLADVIKDYTQTVMLPGSAPYAQLQAVIQPLCDRGLADLRAEGIGEQDIRAEPLLDVRYRGQSYELTVPFSARWREAFERAHHQRYGYAEPEGEVEVVNVRVRAVGQVPSPRLKSRAPGNSDPSAALLERREVTLTSGKSALVPHYLGVRLHPGHQIQGPAIILRPDTTILLGADDTARVDAYENLIIQV